MFIVYGKNSIFFPQTIQSFWLMYSTALKKMGLFLGGGGSIKLKQWKSSSKVLKI